MKTFLLLLLFAAIPVPLASQLPPALQGAWRAIEYVDEDDERIEPTADAIIAFILPSSLVMADDADDVAFREPAACVLSVTAEGETLTLTPASGECPEPLRAATALRFRLTGDELVLYNDAVPNRTVYRRVGKAIPG